MSSIYSGIIIFYIPDPLNEYDANTINESGIIIYLISYLFS